MPPNPNAGPRGPNSPMRGGFAITPDAVTPLPKVTAAIWVGTAGSLVLVLSSGDTVTLTNVPVGRHMLEATHVLPASTASGLVGLY